MGIKLLAVAVVALCPTLAFAQGRPDTTTNRAGQQTNPTARAGADTMNRARADTMQRSESTTTTTTARGEVGGAAETPDIRAARENPNLIGSPAWWRNHTTADGKTGKTGGAAAPKKPSQ